MSDEKTNPYPEMPTDVLQTHIEQLSTVVKEKKIDVTQFFEAGTVTISKEDQTKIDEHASLTTKVEELSKVASAKDLTDNEVTLSQATLDRIVSDIKKIDTDAPLESVLASKFNNLEKISILTDTQTMVEHYQKQIATIKKEVGKGDTSGTQSFSKPDEKSSGAEIIKEMTKKED